MILYMFRTVPLSIVRSFSLYPQQWYMSYRFTDSLQVGSGWKFNMMHGHINVKLKKVVRKLCFNNMYVCIPW